jgi:hypothetical protein
MNMMTSRSHELGSSLVVLTDKRTGVSGSTINSLKLVEVSCKSKAETASFGHSLMETVSKYMAACARLAQS